MLELVE